MTEVIRKQMSRANVDRVPGRGRPKLKANEEIVEREEEKVEIIKEPATLTLLPKRKRGRPRGMKTIGKRKIKGQINTFSNR